MYHNSNIVKNVDTIKNTFDICDISGVIVHSMENDRIKDISANSDKTTIRIFLKNQIGPIILSDFGNIMNLTNCLIVLKKTNSSLNNKHYVDVLNYSETLLDRTDFYHFYNPDTFIYRVDSNKNEIICVDVKSTTSLILHPNPVTIIKRKKNIVYVVNGVTDEETMFKFTNIVNAVKGVEKLNAAFDALRIYCGNTSDDYYEHIQTVPSTEWIVFYGGSPIASTDRFTVNVWDDNGWLIDADIYKEPINNVVKVSFDVESTGKVQLIK